LMVSQRALTCSSEALFSGVCCICCVLAAGCCTRQLWQDLPDDGSSRCESFSARPPASWDAVLSAGLSASVGLSCCQQICHLITSVYMLVFHAVFQVFCLYDPCWVQHHLASSCALITACFMSHSSLLLHQGKVMWSLLCVCHLFVSSDRLSGSTITHKCICERRPDTVGMGKGWPSRSDWILVLIRMWIYDQFVNFLNIGRWAFYMIYCHSPDGDTLAALVEFVLWL